MSVGVGDLRAITAVGLGEDVVDVRLDCRLADEQLRRDLAVRLAGGDEAQDFAFALT